MQEKQSKTSQRTKVLNVLLDYLPHSTYEITEKVFGTVDVTKIGQWRLGARIADLKEDGHTIIGEWGKDSRERRVYYYQLIEPVKDSSFSTLHEYKGEGRQLQLLPACRQY